jgi:hypothetical protein
LADSERHLLEGAALARGIARPYLEVACLAHLGFASTIQSFALARQRCDEAIALAARHGWDAEPVIAPALATLAGILIWTGELDSGEQWLDRARAATQSAGEPGIRLLVFLISAILAASRGHHRQALAELAAARRVQALMVGEHALATQVTAWTMATQARLGMTGQAQATLAALDDRLAAAGEIRSAAAVIRLAERDPAGARRELTSLLDAAAPVNSGFTRVETHLLDALACHGLDDERATRDALEEALNVAEPDRLILPFVVTGGWGTPSMAAPRPGQASQPQGPWISSARVSCACCATCRRTSPGPRSPASYRSRCTPSTPTSAGSTPSSAPPTGPRPCNAAVSCGFSHPAAPDANNHWIPAIPVHLTAPDYEPVGDPAMHQIRASECRHRRSGW